MANQLIARVVLPLNVDRDFTIGAHHLSMLPWGVPSLIAFRGQLARTGDPAVLFISEWPIPWSSMIGAIDKPGLERLHLERFNNDHVAAKGHPAVVYLDAGADPPDFKVRIGKQVIGLDCSAFTVPGRREANGLMVNLRRYLMNQDRSKFAHLFRHVVYVWFPGPIGATGMPYRVTDAEALEELVSALENYKPDASVPPASIPHGMLVERKPVTTEHGATFYAEKTRGAVPTTAVFTRLGFEIGLAFSSTHTADEAWQEIARRVQDHDKPGVDWLLLSAGAPDRQGYMHLSEETLATFAVANQRKLPKPTHIRRVLLHWWTEGRTYEVYPALKRLHEQLYGGVVVAHLRPPGPAPSPAPQQMVLQPVPPSQ